MLMLTQQEQSKGTAGATHLSLLNCLDLCNTPESWGATGQSSWHTAVLEPDPTTRKVPSISASQGMVGLFMSPQTLSLVHMHVRQIR